MLDTILTKMVVYQMMFHLWGNTQEAPVFNGSMQQNGVTKFKDLSTVALKQLKARGITHLYATGIIEHASMEDFSAYGSPLDHPEVVKGRAGSPFAIKDYYDVNPFLADNPAQRMQEFKAMLDRVHAQGLALIIDFVPNHLARQYRSDQKPAGIKDFGSEDQAHVAFDPNNNFYYLPGTQFSVPDGVNPPVRSQVPYTEIPAKVSGNNVFAAKPNINDWYETVKLNYGIDFRDQSKHFEPIPDTWIKMKQVLDYWADLGVDGFRCDMAEMVPVEFWNYAIGGVKKTHPHQIFIAEIYQPALYRDYLFKGGFDYLYDKVGLYDALRRLMENRGQGHTQDITKVWQNESGDFPDRMLRFLENHDEQRIHTPAFAGENFWSSIPGMVLSACMHGGPIMLYFGQEFGEKANEKEGFNQADDRTTMFDFWRVPSHQRWLNHGRFDGKALLKEEKEVEDFYLKLLAFCQQEPLMKEGKFFDLQYAQGPDYPGQKVYSFIRYHQQKALLFVCSFEQERKEFKLHIPDLAKDMMQNTASHWKLQQGFSPPQIPATEAWVKGNTLSLPGNSALVIQLNP